jgi:hypothetical protein
MSRQRDGEKHSSKRWSRAKKAALIAGDLARLKGTDRSRD